MTGRYLGAALIGLAVVVLTGPAVAGQAAPSGQGRVGAASHPVGRPGPAGPVDQHHHNAARGVPPTWRGRRC